MAFLESGNYFDSDSTETDPFLGLDQTSHPWEHECPSFLLLNPSDTLDVQVRQAHGTEGDQGGGFVWEGTR